jgi:hypothetical protein
MSMRTLASIGVALGFLLGQSAIRAEERPDGPAEPAAAAPAPANARPVASPPVVKPPVAIKTSPKKMTVTLAPQKPVPTVPAPPPAPAATVKSAPLKLAPTAAELESERSRPDAPPVPKPRDPRDATPNQNPNWPTHVDHTRGPGSPVGPGTSGDRKGMMQEVSGPQQGVIRNRW